jgi:DNA-binding response OmpR family regulator
MATILIIDDQACIRQLLSDTLAAEGYRVQGVGDVQSVSAHLRRAPPDLVLLDMHLDGLEGFEVLHEIKRQKADLPVVILTAYDSYSDDPRLSQADGYVLKSCELSPLKKKIASILGKKGQHQRRPEKESCGAVLCPAHES